MTGHAPEVTRLDRSKPPPGYHVDEQDDGWWWWVAEPEDGNMEPCDSEADAVAAAWTHHEARHDPPEIWVLYCGEGPDQAERWRFGVPGEDLHDNFRSQADARAAAWAWYWARLALAERLASNVCGFDDSQHWPRALSWSDEQVAEVERWLAEGGDLPEVLRAG